VTAIGASIRGLITTALRQQLSIGRARVAEDLYDVDFVDPKSSTRLAALLGDLAQQMQAEDGSDATLRAIVKAGVGLLPGINWAGISLIRGKVVTSQAPSDDVARTLDQLQGDLGDGPGVSALRDHHTVVIPDLADESRWPRFVAAATDMGVRCMLSFRLFVDSGSLGALNLYGPQRVDFTDEEVTTGEILAQHAAVAIAGAAAEEQLQIALASRDVIGQAKGILMQRDNLTGLQAFATLTRASQETNVKLVDVAKWFVAEHEKGTG
jgi:GAF domain-containing protein